jgi:hypothetical protein
MALANAGSGDYLARAIAAGYDWSHMAARYDAAFADVVAGRSYGTIAGAD